VLFHRASFTSKGVYTQLLHHTTKQTQQSTQHETLGNNTADEYAMKQYTCKRVYAQLLHHTRKTDSAMNTKHKTLRDNTTNGNAMKQYMHKWCTVHGVHIA